MLPGDTKQLMANIPRKERNIATPTELEAVLLPALILQLYITKPKQESLLHAIYV